RTRANPVGSGRVRAREGGPAGCGEARRGIWLREAHQHDALTVLGWPAPPRFWGGGPNPGAGLLKRCHVVVDSAFQTDIQRVRYERMSNRYLGQVRQALEEL